MKMVRTHVLLVNEDVNEGNDKGPSSNQSPRMDGRGFATARADTRLHIILLQINYCTTSEDQLRLLL